MYDIACPFPLCFPYLRNVALYYNSIIPLWCNPMGVPYALLDPPPPHGESNSQEVSQQKGPVMWSLTHWGRATHIRVGNLTTIGSDNGLSPGRRQAITWTSVGILLIEPQGTNFSEMLIEIPTFSFKKIHLTMSFGKWRPFCLGLNVLIM